MTPSTATCRLLLVGLLLLSCATVPEERTGPALWDAPPGAPADPAMASGEPSPSGRAPQEKPGTETGNLTVENRLPEPATLFLDGMEVATVEPGTVKQIFGLAVGDAELKAVADSGRTFQQKFHIVADSTEAWILAEGQGQVLVRNHVGETVELMADGHVLGVMQPLAALRFPLAAGPHQLQVRCVVCEHTATVLVVVTGGAVTEAILGPQPGRLVLVNRTAEPLSFHRNGRPLTRVQPGTRAELAGQPLGNHLVEAVTDAGIVVRREKIQVAPKDQDVARIEVAETAIIVRIRNDSGETVRVFEELSPEPPEIPPGAEGIARVPGLSGVVKIKGTVTGNRYDRRVEGKPGSEIAVALAPIAMGVMVHNGTSRPVELLLDGTALATVQPGESLVRNGVPPGRHRLEAKAAEEPVDEVAFQLKGGDWYSWRLEEKLGSLQVSNRTSEKVQILLDGAGAGELPAGGSTLFGKLPLRTMTATARSESGRLHAFTFTSRPGGKVEWVIHAESGGALIRGLGGIGGTVFVDGRETGRIEPGSPDPWPVPMEPGAHVLRVAGNDGRERLGTILVAPEVYSPFLAGASDPEVELRNKTSDRLLLVIDGLSGGEVQAGGTVELLLSGPGPHTIHATSPDGTGSWRLENIPFAAGARFGWTVGE